MKFVYFIVSHPIQYFVPLYREIAHASDMHVTAFFCTKETIESGKDEGFGVQVRWDIPLLEGYEYKFLPNRAFTPSISYGFWGLFNPGIIGELFRAPKGLVVIGGWQFASYVLGMIAAKLFGHKVAIRCEAPAVAESRKSSLKNVMRTFILRHVILRWLADYCLYIGTQNKRFYEMHKVKKEKMFFSPYSIDNTRFKQQAESTDKVKTRSELGIAADDFVIVFTAKFIQRKRPLDLIQAYQQLNVSGKKLIMVGEGELRQEMEDYIRSHSIEGISMPGFINQNEIVNYYAIADVFVMCSEFETWGLSVNEAMACGVPVIVSDTVGCSSDLIAQPYGKVFTKGNVDELTSCLKSFALQEKGSNEVHRGLREKINEYSIEETSKSIVRLAEKVSLRMGYSPTHHTKSSIK